MVTENKEKKFFHLPKWEEYVLRKMNQLYNKTELCDVTLKFPDDDTVIQAHKVILKACSGFFDVLPPATGGIVLHMPKNMKPQHVKVLISCMYTGKLEYEADEHSILSVVAKQLGMNYIIELLQKQATSTSSTSSPRPKNDVRATPKKFVSKQLPATPMSVDVPPIHQIAAPTPPPASDTPPSNVLPGKKLPIWKQRTTVHLPEDFYRSVNKKLHPAVHEDPKPTRFEWPEDDDLPEVCLPQNLSMDSFENLSYDSQVIITPCRDPKPVVSEDSIERMPTSAPPLLGKRARVSEVIRGRAEEDDDYDDGHFESIHDIDDDVEDEDTTNNVSEVIPVSTPPKPILKTFSSPPSSKKVRFAVSTETKTAPTPVYTHTVNESQGTPSSSIPLPSSSVAATPTTATAPPFTTSLVNTGVSSFNHAKIINEILKKFPDLTKNKNIKLKIQAGNTPAGLTTSSGIPDKEGKGQTKVQYIVLKSDLNNLKKEVKEPPNGAENTTGPWTCVPCADDNGPIQFDTYYKYRRHLQEVHNERIDARICEHCGFKASKRNLHLYHLYTKHNIAPPRNINFPKCDQCNYIALSESLLIKHRSNHTGMVTKEYICQLCNAAFKSHGALMGHMQTNLHQTDQAAKKDYECEYCGKIFNRNINLKAHIRTSHQEESIRKMYDDEDRTEDPPELEVPTQEKTENQNQNVMEVIEVPVFDSVSGGNKTLYLPQGMTILTETPTVPLMPSSESEAMNNVATGIATSINITDRNMPNDVLVLDGSSTEIILRGPPTTYVMNTDGSYSLQEYIVPEIMADSGQVYTTALVTSAPAAGITYVNSDISIISSSDHTYADGMKMNGHVNAGTPVSIVSSVNATPHVQTVTQATQPIIVNADWMQTIATSQGQTMELSQSQTQEIISQPLNQNVEIISSQPMTQCQNVEIISQPMSQKDPLGQIPQPLIQVNTESQTDAESPAKTAQTLVSDWADLDEDNQEESQDGDDESEKKPSRPTIELEANSEIDM